jgi:hypothetical protein
MKPVSAQQNWGGVGGRSSMNKGSKINPKIGSGICLPEQRDIIKIQTNPDANKKVKEK